MGIDRDTLRKAAEVGSHCPTHCYLLPHGRKTLHNSSGYLPCAIEQHALPSDCGVLRLDLKLMASCSKKLTSRQVLAEIRRLLPTNVEVTFPLCLLFRCSPRIHGDENSIISSATEHIDDTPIPKAFILTFHTLNSITCASLCHDNNR